MLPDLGIRVEPGIRLPEAVGRHGKAAHESQLEPRLLVEAGRHGVMTTGHDENARPAEEPAQPGGWGRSSVVHVFLLSAAVVWRW
jgi:hypothetical protein